MGHVVFIAENEPAIILFLKKIPSSRYRGSTPPKSPGTQGGENAASIQENERGPGFKTATREKGLKMTLHIFFSQRPSTFSKPRFATPRRNTGTNTRLGRLQNKGLSSEIFVVSYIRRSMTDKSILLEIGSSEMRIASDIKTIREENCAL